MNKSQHWENVYNTRGENEVTWFQNRPSTSLNLINLCDLMKDDLIIDIGSGTSKLVNNLTDLGFKNITLLDISKSALDLVKKRTYPTNCQIKFISKDITKHQLVNKYSLWHDRAVFHFLTCDKDKKAYLKNLEESLLAGGYFLISTFSTNGPQKCSNLPVSRYSKESLEHFFQSSFKLVDSKEEEHISPKGNSQNFIYCLFKKR